MIFNSVAYKFIPVAFNGMGTSFYIEIVSVILTIAVSGQQCHCITYTQKEKETLNSFANTDTWHRHCKD